MRLLRRALAVRRPGAEVVFSRTTWRRFAPRWHHLKRFCPAAAPPRGQGRNAAAPPLSALLPAAKKNPPTRRAGGLSVLAESWGFEPQIPLGGILA